MKLRIWEGVKSLGQLVWGWVRPTPRKAFFLLVTAVAAGGTLVALMVDQNDPIIIAANGIPRVHTLAESELGEMKGDRAEGEFGSKSELVGRVLIRPLEKGDAITESDLLPVSPDIREPALVRVNVDPGSVNEGEFVSVYGLDKTEKGKETARRIANVAYVVEVQEDSVDIVLGCKDLDDVLRYQIGEREIRLVWPPQ